MVVDIEEYIECKLDKLQKMSQLLIGKFLYFNHDLFNILITITPKKNLDLTLLVALVGLA
jgi:hypothetical protein